ncbi:MAG TPA: ROK family protein [Atribacterota bacterium]|nr:ROK family protein [Atribacterota bacterium]
MHLAENIDKKKSKWTIGVDLGGTKISVGLINETGKIEQYLKIPTQAEQGQKETINRIKQSIYQIIELNNLKIGGIAGIGIGAPGPVDYQRGIVHCAPNLPGWTEVPLADIMRKEFPIPIKVENDANAAAWGEKIFGVARGIDELVCLTLGTGIGGGLILCGEIYHGKNFVAGEIGHMVVNKIGPRCNCGKNGCLEAYSSAAGIRDRISKRIASLKSQPDNQKFLNIYNLENIGLAQIFELARQGNMIVKDIVEEAIEYLGIAIISLVNILNPEMVILLGGIANEGEKLLNPIKEIVFQGAMSSHLPDLKIVLGKLGVFAGVIGAAALLWEHQKYYTLNKKGGPHGQSCFKECD